MHSQTLIPILVFWVAILCSTRVGSNVLTIEQRTELVNKLNALVRHPGWQCMDDVKILKKKREELADPVSEILEDISLNRQPIDGVNVLEKHVDIWTVLMCKYGEVFSNYKVLVQHYIRICKSVKTVKNSFRTYYECFETLLMKIHNMSSRCKCMVDAMDFVYSLNPPSKHKFLLTGAQKFTDYTLNLGPEIGAKLSEQGINVGLVDLEMKTINEHFSKVYIKNIYWFIADHCTSTRTKRWTVPSLGEDYINAKTNGLISPETTMLRYVENEIDDYVHETFGKWFYDLGFAYDDAGNVTVRTIP